MRILNLRVKFIQFLIEINEKILFYPKLRAFYKKRFSISFSKDEKFIVFDVGSNRGQTIDFFLSINRSSIIYAFEPNPKLFQELQRKFGSNTNIKIFNLGISNVNGELLLKETITDETSSFEDLNYNSNYLKMKANVLGVKKEELVSKEYLVIGNEIG